MRLSTVFHSQTDRQMEWMNQELEQYLRFFTEYRQKDQLEWLATVEQQSQFSNKDIIFHSKLWKRIENGGRHQKKRKSRERVESQENTNKKKRIQKIQKNQ